MRAPGPIALIGGGEHLESTLAIDRRLLELAGVSRPRVVVLPQAPSSGQRAKTVALARNHWTRIGATFGVATIDHGIDRAYDELSSADIAVIPGGHPNKLISGLGASHLTDLLTSRWLQGMAISGSSAGAMGLFEWRIKLYPPNPLKLLPGLGLLDGYVAAPHFDRFRADRWASRVIKSLNGLGVIGIDEATALVGWNGEFEVVGPGSVNVVGGQRNDCYAKGEQVSIDVTARRHQGLGATSSPRWSLPSRFQVDFETARQGFAANGSRSVR